MRRMRRMNNEQGSALIYVIIMFLVIGIFSASMATIFSANLRQTKQQQDSLEAYYLAYSGAMIAYEALLANENAKLTELIDDDATFTEGPKSMGGGSVIVSAAVSEDANFEDWIKITSTATLDRNSTSSSRTLYFDPANPLEMLWTSN